MREELPVLEGVFSALRAEFLPVVCVVDFPVVPDLRRGFGCSVDDVSRLVINQVPLPQQHYQTNGIRRSLRGMIRLAGGSVERVMGGRWARVSPLHNSTIYHEREDHAPVLDRMFGYNNKIMTQC